jgi:hypothetical protein
MNIASLLIASIIGAVVSTALSNIPFLNLINCLLCAGFWVGAILATWVYKRQTGSVTLGQGIAIGTLTGLLAGLLGFVLSLVGLAGAVGIVKTYGSIFAADSNPDLSSIKGSWVAVFNMIGIMANIFFGAIGGLVGGVIFKSKPQAS